ncbi:MAG: urease accessory protein UreD [Alphaproteobacteria bacterium]
MRTQAGTRGSVIAPSRAEVTFGREANGSTFVRRQFASYPFHFCRPHHFAGDAPGMVTLYVQSLSGGIYENERLSLAVVAEPETRAHVTSQASTIVHSMDAEHAETTVAIDAGEAAVIEYMPDPLILFPEARLCSTMSIRRHDTAVVICADAFLIHDPENAGRPFGYLDSRLDITDDDGKLLARDRLILNGDSFLSRRVIRKGGYVALATVTVVAPKALSVRLVKAMREALSGLADTYAGASTLPNACGAWVRLLAADGASLRAATEAAWAAARETITGQRPDHRRK